MRTPFTWRVWSIRVGFIESRTLDVVRKLGGNLHLKLNIDLRPIANKYREGKMKRTLERELKVPEIAKREANGTSFLCLRLLLTKGNFGSARAVNLIWTSAVFL